MKNKFKIIKQILDIIFSFVSMLATLAVICYICVSAMPILVKCYASLLLTYMIGQQFLAIIVKSDKNYDTN